MYRIRQVDGIVEHEVLTALTKICGDYSMVAETDSGDWWLAYAGDVAVGFGGLRDATTEPGASFLCLAGVVPEHRGHGLQRRLIHARVRRARALGKRRVVTYTHIFNAASANSLIASGFRIYQPALVFGGGDYCYWKKEINAHPAIV